jgi:hypothetical protein
MPVKRTNIHKVTTTNAALLLLMGREVTNRFVAAVAGSTVEATRYRGGCWKVSGTDAAVEALKAKLRQANSRVLHPKAKTACKVVRRPPMVPEGLREEVYHGRTVVLTQHYTARGPRYVAHAPSWGTFKASTTTGTCPEEVYDRLTERLPVVVRETTFKGAPIEVIRVHRKDGHTHVAYSGDLRRSAPRGQRWTARDAEKAVISALGGGKRPRTTYHKAPRVGTFQGREWQDDQTFDSPFSGLKG